ncbi:MAG: PLDc_N domain-containing protein, partial [Candidatus Methanomethylophilaceae archaeon]|nr:PLDc_N domain-containing protein [Candidatus Methanomethylophilaceae archaeon]
MFLLVLLVTEKKNPSKIVVWALVFLILPFVGFILYIFIGQTVYSDRAFRIKSLNDEKTKELVDYDKSVADNEEVPEYRQLA